MGCAAVACVPVYLGKKHATQNRNAQLVTHLGVILKLHSALRHDGSVELRIMSFLIKAGVVAVDISPIHFHKRGRKAPPSV